MPRIPIYEQRVVANVTPNTSRMSAGNVGRAMQAFGGAVQDFGEQMSRQQKEREESEGRLWAAKSASEADLAMAEHLQKKQQSAGAGAPNFTPSFLEDYDKYTDEALKNAPSPYAKSIMQAHFASSREAYGRAALSFEANERTRFAGQQIDDGVQMSATLVNGNPAWFDREMGKWASAINGAGIDEASKQKLRDGARKSLVNAAVVSWIDRNPSAAASTLEDMQKSGDVMRDVSWTDKSGTYRVPVNLGTLDERMRWADYAKQKVEQSRQELGMSLRYEIQNAEAMARTGVSPTGPARSRADFAAAFKNPQVAEFEYNRYTTARQTATAVSSLSGKSTADLIGVIQQKPQASDPNFAVTAEAHAIQARAAADIVQQRQQDPVAYAIQAGDFKLQPLEPQKPAEFTEELKRRSAALGGMHEKYGAASVLSKKEAEVLGKQFDLLPADRKVEQLESMRASIADDTVYASVLNSIRPDSPVTALVGNIAAAGSKNNARMIALGEDLLNPSKAGKSTDGRGAFPMPPETDMRQAWVDAVGDAYRGYPEAEATAYQAYKAYYAASAAQKGFNDPKQGANESLVRDAISASTGGVMRWSTDWFGNDTPSANLILPYGMPVDIFRERAAAEWARVRDALGYTKTSIGDIGLYNTGSNGEYMVMSGASWLPDKEGRPVILRVK